MPRLAGQSQRADYLEWVEYAGELEPQWRRGWMYAHRGEGDLFKIAASHNAQRELANLRDGKPKLYYHVIAASSDEARALADDKVRQTEFYLLIHDRLSGQVEELEQKIEEISHSHAGVEPDHFNSLASARSALEVVRALLKATRDTEVFGPEQLPLLESRRDKLHILGHGRAGGSALSTRVGDKWIDFSLREVAQKLEGLLKHDFIDFRLRACSSADSEAFPDFEECRPRAPENSKRATAQIFLDELIAAGFKDATVCGYQQNGVTFGAVQSMRRNRSGTSERTSKAARKWFRSERALVPAAPQTPLQAGAPTSLDGSQGNSLLRDARTPRGVSKSILGDARATETGSGSTFDRPALRGPRLSWDDYERDEQSEGPAFDPPEAEEAAGVAEVVLA